MSLATLVLAAALQPGGIIAWIIGAFIGGLILNLLAPDATFGFWGSLIVALIGACILVAIVHAVQRGRTGTSA